MRLAVACSKGMSPQANWILHFIDECLGMKRNQNCSFCRQALDKLVPMIPNIAMDNTVEKHIKALAISGSKEWEPDGRKYTEWFSRKRCDNDS
jgi:hypothetical protein